MASGSRVWVGCALLAAVSFGAGACRTDDAEPIGAGGDSGEGGGASASAGGAECQNGLAVVAQFDAPADDAFGRVVSWPAQRRFAVTSWKTVAIYEVASNGSVAQIEELDATDFGATEPAYLDNIVAYGTGFVAAVYAERSTNDVSTLVHWTPEGGAQELLQAAGPSMTIGAASEGVGIAVAVQSGRDRVVYLAQPEGDGWAWSEPMGQDGRQLAPLAFGDGYLLVGVDEVPRFIDLGAGGEGGGAGVGGASEGGAGSGTDARKASVQLWSLAGALLETHAATGSPAVAIAVDEGWLIGETNNFWGSYQAGIELLTEFGELRTLSRVPVISSTDGEDGAFDLALLGERLLVANCESGLLASAWSTEELTLEKVPGPWHEKDYGCAPRTLEVVGDLAAIVGDDRVVFVRACD